MLDKKKMAEEQAKRKDADKKRFQAILKKAKAELKAEHDSIGERSKATLQQQAQGAI